VNSDKRLFWISPCDACKGEPTKDYYSAPQHLWTKIGCPACNGTGEIREEAKVPADDGEAISRDWAGSVGGVPDEGSGRSLLFFRDEMNDSLAFDLFLAVDEWRATMYSGGAKLCFWPRPITTRGDLRRLCAALGVELKEGE
jgi:hypothetical protein